MAVRTEAPAVTRVAAAAFSFLLPVAYLSSVSAAAWSPKAAVLLVALGIGLPRLVSLVWSDARAPALAGLAFIAAAILSTALSAQPMLAVLGLYNWGTGLLFVAALPAIWAVGAGVGRDGRNFVEGGLVAAVIVNAIVAVFQAAAPANTGLLTRFDGRAAGLLANPIYLGALSVAAFPLLFPRVEASRWRWGAVLALAAAAVEMSGSRVALGLAVLAAVVLVVRVRRRAVIAVVAVALGIALGAGLAAIGGTTTGTGRVSSSGGGFGARRDVWASATHSIGEHPFVGVGPGLFRSATSPHRTLSIVRAEGPDRYFVDAHDLVVEYATTTGILGLASFLGLLVLLLRRAQGPLLWFAVMLLAVHLVEPQFVGTVPLVFLALGAAAPALAPPRLPIRLFTVPFGLAALAAGAVFLLGEHRLHEAALDFNPREAQRADNVLPPWPEPAELRGRIALYLNIRTRSAAERASALHWRHRAAHLDPTDPSGWTRLGEAQAYFGDIPAAYGSFRTALRWDPWSLIALNDTGKAALALGDNATARRVYRRSLVVQPKQPDVRRALDQLGG